MLALDRLRKSPRLIKAQDLPAVIDEQIEVRKEVLTQYPAYARIHCLKLRDVPNDCERLWNRMASNLNQVELTDFLLELGNDFAFVGRQRRVRIDDNWFRVDLVFFHRRLKSLLVVDLKIDRFSYADAGYGKPDVMKSAA
jgi:hypothetical protein